MSAFNKNFDWTGVILAGGEGKRMRSETPKPLHRICGLTLLEHSIGVMREAGVGAIVVVTSPTTSEEPEFRRIVASDSAISVAIQPEKRGTADALLCGLSEVPAGRKVLVGPADTVLIGVETLRQLMCEPTGNGDVARPALVVAEKEDAQGFGRVRRDEEGYVRGVVEEVDLEESEWAIREVNVGWYGFARDEIEGYLRQIEPSTTGELFLTDVAELLARAGKAARAVVCDEREALGINDRAQLAYAETELRRRINRRLNMGGVTIQDPLNTYIDALVEVGAESVILAGSHISGRSVVGQGCVIGPNAVIKDSRLGDGVTVGNASVESSVLGSGVRVGAYARVRGNSVLGDNVVLGSGAEVKGSKLGAGTMANHFCYIGDAEIGTEVNIGASTVTCNYDGARKHKTVIGSGAFIGSGSMLVAPLRIGAGARTGAGSVVTHDVEPGQTVYGTPARVKGHLE